MRRYVLREGLRKREKTTHELLIKCVIIITSVVPRQFPMQVGFITINSFSESSGISSSTSTAVIVVVVVVAGSNSSSSSSAWWKWYESSSAW